MKEWIEAMRLRTLPVSIAGVLAGTACACLHNSFRAFPFLICLFFAVIAQIASNFANEYYDYKNGLDRKGREGFRRGVTEGDISPEAMKRATYYLLAIDAALGCSLIVWGGWWLVIAGIIIFLFALGYSTGPWPLSHHGLGDIAVIIFFGIVPVVFTEYVQTELFPRNYITWFIGLAVGFMAANVLIVNNYRDYEDDRAVGKHTSVVILGRQAMAGVYLVNGILGALLLAMATSPLPFWVSAGWLGYIAFHFMLWGSLKSRRGKELNSVLKFTAILLFAVTVYLLIVCACHPDSPKSPYPFL